MRLSDFDYTLPKELIAQYPSKSRGDDRLLVVDRARKSFEEKKFIDITGYFKEGDLLVLNDTRVIPARLYGKRKTGANVEIFLMDTAGNPVEALVRPSGRIREGESVLLDSGDEARVLGRSDIGRLVEFDKPLDEIMKKCGHMPLPPYISRPDEAVDRERYQTVYASSEGATASPTAGLHFTGAIISGLRKKGVRIACITLHVSYGTFAPIKEEEVENHKMHSEFYHISEENAIIIDEAQRKKARIFACGTTSLRALETYAEVAEPEGFTDLFIYPGYKFKAINALITNFHLPKSTLLLLTSAFCGKELLFKAYDYAIRNQFSFFSYGDAMLVL
ncbi:MAG: tRNA preQ1(34) S-adenosylmethionine ribosyltransferase-isomerase QueA [Candidatus Omnitrophota bacterium]